MFEKVLWISNRNMSFEERLSIGMIKHIKPIKIKLVQNINEISDDIMDSDIIAIDTLINSDEISIPISDVMAMIEKEKQ